MAIQSFTQNDDARCISNHMPVINRTIYTRTQKLFNRLMIQCCSLLPGKEEHRSELPHTLDQPTRTANFTVSFRSSKRSSLPSQSRTAPNHALAAHCQIMTSLQARVTKPLQLCTPFLKMRTIDFNVHSHFFKAKQETTVTQLLGSF